MQEIEVFADVGCPYTHAGLRALVAQRTERGLTEPLLRVRAWPLEIVNDGPLTGSSLAPGVEALQDGPAPLLFGGFDAADFPPTTLPALVSTAAAYRAGAETGEAFSLAVRDALWERGRDVADHAVLAELRTALGVPDPTTADNASIDSDLAEGRARGVTGSPHFFTSSGDFFCPTLTISHDDGSMQVTFDADGFHQFVSAVFG